MKLDNTRIAVRERGLLDICDLALHVAREFVGPWLGSSLLAVIPLMLINYALIGWMADVDFEQDVPGRFLWNMTLLIIIEAPLASIFTVAYLGPAVFLEKRTTREVLKDVLRCSPHLLLCQLLLRGILPAWLLLLTVDRYEFNGFVEGFLLPVIALGSCGLRAFRPYINEIILLEKNPLWSRNPATITVGKRSNHLHGPSSADLMVRWISSALIAALLFLLALTTAVVKRGVLIGEWTMSLSDDGSALSLDWFQVQILYPLCLWSVAAYFSVVRFLSYLDLRIRHEGWEVELLMRAEAARLVARVG
jgi:hypothetical protein